MTLQEAFEAGVAAAKEAIKTDICEMYECWDQADSTERCYYVDAVEVKTPELK